MKFEFDVVVTVRKRLHLSGPADRELARSLLKQSLDGGIALHTFAKYDGGMYPMETIISRGFDIQDPVDNPAKLPESDGMLALIIEALSYQSRQFDGPGDQDLNVSGADMVDWFTDWRRRLRTALHDEGTAELRAESRTRSLSDYDLAAIYAGLEAMKTDLRLRDPYAAWMSRNGSVMALSPRQITTLQKALMDAERVFVSEAAQVVRKD